MNTDTGNIMSLQTKAILLVMEKLAGKPPRPGQFPIHPAAHSLKIGNYLIGYGFSLPICLAGQIYSLWEEEKISLDTLTEEFGDDVAFYVPLCSLDPKVNNEHSDDAEDELFGRVKAFTADKRDVGPLAIQCVNSMCLVREAKYCPREEQKLLNRASRWLALAMPYLTESHRDLINDFGLINRQEGIRILAKKSRSF